MFVLKAEPGLFGLSTNRAATLVVGIRKDLRDGKNTARLERGPDFFECILPVRYFSQHREVHA